MLLRVRGLIHFSSPVCATCTISPLPCRSTLIDPHHITISPKNTKKMERRSICSIALVLFCIVMAASQATSSSSETAFVKKTISSHKIVIFSKSYCPYCRRAKAVFKELKQEPFVVELDERDDGSDIQEALSEIVGRRTVPQVFIDGKHIGGSDDTVEAYQSGKLAELLGIDVEDEDDDREDL